MNVDELIRERFTSEPDPAQLTLDEIPPRIGSLFSGYEGLGLGVRAAIGGETVFVSDIEPAANAILAHRLPGIPNLGDIAAVDWATVPAVDVLTGGFPCQDVSMAGRRAGMHTHTRSGLWDVMAGAIEALRPGLVVIENVRGLLSADAHSNMESCSWCLGNLAGEPTMRALGAVLGDLAGLGYDAAWFGLPAADVGAPHGRFRVFIVATPDTGLLPARRGAASGREESRRARAELAGRRNDPPPDADVGRRDRRERQPIRGEIRGAPVTGGGSDAPPDGDGLEELRRQHAEQRHADGRGSIAWGRYERAIRRWEVVLGRPAPAPTEAGPKGGQRLSPRFVEWMMGLPAGWVTDVPGLTRNQQLKALGNGVVPQQAEAAVRHLLRRDIWTPTSPSYASSSVASHHEWTPTSAQGIGA